MIDRRLLPEHLHFDSKEATAEAQFDRVAEFYNQNCELRPWVRYFHPVTGSMKRALGRDCEDGMRLMERNQ